LSSPRPPSLDLGYINFTLKRYSYKLVVKKRPPNS